MSITMFLKETESGKSLCKEAKMKTARVNLKDVGKFSQYCEVNRFIDLAAAEAKLGKENVTEIKRRNKVRSTGEIKAEKIKEKGDLATLKPFTREETTTWVDLTIQSPAVAEEIMKSGAVLDMMNAWDMLSFEEMGTTCGKCTLSWDKGRGCVATLMGGDSPLPDIAKKYGLKVIADIPGVAEKQTVFGEKEAKEILAELEKLKKELPKEGKLMERRLAGTIERLESMAKVAAAHGVPFYFSS